MKPSLLFINKHYAPDIAATGQMLADLAEYLVEDGFEVHVLCGQSRYEEGHLQLPRFEIRNGVHVHRVSTTGFGRNRVVGRLLDYATFYVHALRFMLGRARADVSIVLTTPPLMHVAAVLGKRIRKRPFGIWSMDLHPDAEVAVGMLQEKSLLTRFLHLVNDMGYREADFIITLGACMSRRVVKKGVSSARIHEIPVWTRCDEIRPLDREKNPLVQRLKLGNRFVVMYSGNAGLGHRFDEIKQAMAALKDRDDILFLFVGAGPKRDEIEKYIRQHNLTTALYLDYFRREDIHLSLALGDVHLVSLKEEMTGIAVPSKVYGAMAAGRPIVFIGPSASASAQTIADTACGVVIDPALLKQKQPSLETILKELAMQPQVRAKMGTRGRSAAVRTYDVKPACEKWSALLQSFHSSNGHEPLFRPVKLRE